MLCSETVANCRFPWDMVSSQATAPRGPAKPTRAGQLLASIGKQPDIHSRTPSTLLPNNNNNPRHTELNHHNHELNPLDKMQRIILALSMVASAAVGVLAADLKVDVTTAVECERKTQKGDTIEVHYRGTLENGNKFDASTCQLGRS